MRVSPSPSCPPAFALLLLVACTGAPDVVPDRDDGGSTVRDAGAIDAGTPDAGAPDAAVPSCAGSYATSTDAPIDESALRGPGDDPLLLETSGLAASRLSARVLWAHNDSGDTARLFALRDDGYVLGALTLPGVQAVDFEDLAAAACPDGSGRACLWIADSGNNLLERTDLAIYAVPEPDVDATRAFGTKAAEQVWRFPFSYPGDEGFDSEALVVDPDGSAAWLFEKSEAREVHVFRYAAPFTSAAKVVESVGKFIAPGMTIPHGTNITAADLHPSRQRIVVRVYTGAFEYRFTNTDWAAELVAGRGRTVAFVPRREQQGEAIAYDAAGTGIWTGSEDPALAAPVPLHHHACE